MYVREKKVRKGDKTYSYWEVVRGSWVNGKSKQKVVAYIGALPAWWERSHVSRWGKDPKSVADLLARMDGLLCAVRGCGNGGLEKHVLEYVPPLGKSKKPKEAPVAICAKHLAAFRSGETSRSVVFLRQED